MNIPRWLELLLTIITAVIANSGFMVFLSNKLEKKDAKVKMILGLGHDRIIQHCKDFIEQGWISTEDYENLYEYLYVPYKAMGGNGTAQRMMERVEKLPTTPPDISSNKTENVENDNK